MTLLELLERVDPQLLVLFGLLVLLPFAALALVVAARNRSDRRAAAVVRARRPRRMPANLATRMWDFDQYGRPF